VHRLFSSQVAQKIASQRAENALAAGQLNSSKQTQKRMYMYARGKKQPASISARIA
jgi:hypothetical protein